MHCKICGFPIMPIGCLHKALGFTDEQWLAMNEEQRNEALYEATPDKPNCSDENAVENEIHGNIV